MSTNNSKAKLLCDAEITQCVVPENIHTPPTEGIGISWGVGVFKDLKF